METKTKVRLMKELKKYLVKIPFWFENANKDFRSLKVFVTCVMLFDKYLVLNNVTPMFFASQCQSQKGVSQKWFYRNRNVLEMYCFTSAPTTMCFKKKTEQLSKGSSKQSCSRTSSELNAVPLLLFCTPPMHTLSYPNCWFKVKYACKY